MTDPATTPVAGQAPTEAQVWPPTDEQVRIATATIRKAATSSVPDHQRALGHDVERYRVELTAEQAAAAERLAAARTRLDAARDEYGVARDKWTTARNELKDLTR